MWTADPRARRSRAAGFTMLEVTIYMALVGLVGLVVEETFRTMRDATETFNAMGRVQQRTEMVANRLREEVASSRKLFFRGTIGAEYLEALDVSRAEPAPGTRLPLPDEASPLEVDDSEVPRTANTILFVRETDPVVCSASAAVHSVRYVDVYRFVCIYPHERAGRRVLTRETAPGRDLVLWRSIGYPSHPQIMAIENPAERARIVKALHDQYGFRHAWNPEAPYSQAFYALDTLGTLAATPSADLQIAEDPGASPGGLLLFANCQLARTDATSFVRRSLLTADAPEVWRPDGFEVKIVGPSGNRQVWMRVTAEAQSATTRDVAHYATVLAPVRDF